MKTEDWVFAEIQIVEYKARFYSSYINQFTQPDSIVPDPANPQAFNRYSYVMNSPIGYNDPSGHEPKYGCYTSTNGQCQNANGTSIIEGNGRGGGGGGDDGDTDTNGNGIPDKPDPTWVIPPSGGPCMYDTLLECLYSGGAWPSGDTTFTDEEWAEFEYALYLDIYRRSQEGEDGFWTSEFDPTGRYADFVSHLKAWDFKNWNPSLFLPFHSKSYYDREFYDTPFWDHKNFYSGNVCFESGDCYPRNDVNYIAQGMWSAAASEGYHGALGATTGWKFTQYGYPASYGANSWAMQGVTSFVINGFYDISRER